MGPEHRVLVHKPEGCIFLWVWFRDLPISAEQLYFKLKEKGVLIIPGHLFFPGQEVSQNFNCLKYQIESETHVRRDRALTGRTSMSA